MKIRFGGLGALLIAASCSAPSPTVESRLPSENEAAVSPLLRILREGDIVAREQAMEKLVELGPDALPVLRLVSASEGDGDVVGRLKPVIEKLEEQDRLVKLVGRPPLISLSRRNAPLAMVLKELEALSGVPVGTEGLSPNLEVTVITERQPIWAAIDDLCRRHGRIRPRWSDSGVTVVAGEFFETPHLDWTIGSVPMGRFSLEYSLETREWQKTPVLGIRPRLLLKPGKRLFEGGLFLDFLQEPGALSISLEDEDRFYFDGDCVKPSPLTNLEFQALLYRVRRPLPQEIARSKGTIYFHIHHKTKRFVLMDGLKPHTEAKDPDTGQVLHLDDVTFTPDEMKIKFWTKYDYVGRGRIDAVEGLRLVSKTGRHLYPAEAKQQSAGGSMGMEDWYTEARFVTACAEEWTRLEILQPDYEAASVIRLEFDFPRLTVSSR